MSEFSLSSAPAITPTVPRIGAAHELLRQLVGRWPFRRGTTRIPALLGTVFDNFTKVGVVGGVGAGDVLFPFESGDLGRPSYWFLYEKAIRSLLRRMLRPGSGFIDIGAHNGWHSAFALGLVSPGGFVLACEPHPYHARRLRNLAMLNAGKQLEVFEAAISAQAGELTLLGSEREGWDTIHTVVPEFDQLFSAPRREIRVAALSLDELIDRRPDVRWQDKPDRIVIKIDAEGSELSILQGATRTLRLPSIQALIIECTGGPDPLRERALRCIEILKTSGWKTSVITEKGALRDWTEGDSRVQVNVLAVREHLQSCRG